MEVGSGHPWTKLNTTEQVECGFKFSVGTRIGCCLFFQIGEWSGSRGNNSVDLSGTCTARQSGLECLRRHRLNRMSSIGGAKKAA